MRAIVLTALGDSDNLKLEQRPDPRPGPGEAVVRLHAAALNRRDVWIRKGQYAGIKLPIILGSDGADEVVDVGERVDRAWQGRQVVMDPSLNWGGDERAQDNTFNILGLPTDGTYAVMVIVPAANLHPKPALDALKPGGRLVSYGSTLGAAQHVEVRRIFRKQLNVLGSTMGSPSDFTAMLKLYEAGLKPVVDKVFPLEQAGDAHIRMEAGDQFGK